MYRITLNGLNDMGKNDKLDKNVIKSIKTSSEKLGQLYPVLLDANDEIIDGDHRKKALVEPKTLRLPHIKSKKDRLAARLVANHARRGQHRSTWTPTLDELGRILSNEGIELIGKQISEMTGLPYRTVMRHLPDQYKNKAQSLRASHPRLPSGTPALLEPLEDEGAMSECLPQSSAESQTPAKTSVGETAIVESKDPCQIIEEFKPLSESKRPNVEIKEFANQHWRAIILPQDFYFKLRDICEKRGLDMEEVVTLALMRLVEELKRIKP